MQVQEFAGHIIAERGVRHGHVVYLPAARAQPWSRRDASSRLPAQSTPARSVTAKTNSVTNSLTAPTPLFTIADGGSRKGSKGNAVRVPAHTTLRLPPQL
jgi:hypothetical protein